MLNKINQLCKKCDILEREYVTIETGGVKNASGTVMTSANYSANVTCGFKPSKVICFVSDTGNYTTANVLVLSSYIDGVTTTYYTSTKLAIKNDSTITINDDGFTVSKNSSTFLNCCWIAIE